MILMFIYVGSISLPFFSHTNDERHGIYCMPVLQTGGRVLYDAGIDASH